MTVSTNNEIYKQLLELAVNEEQVRYLTATNDTIKDGKIETLQSQIGMLQHNLSVEETRRRESKDITMSIIDSLIKKATRYDSDCC